MKENPSSKTTKAHLQEYRLQLHRYVSNRVSSKEEAEDIVHNVLLRAYVNSDSLEETKSWKSWLYTIARNAIIDYYRTRKPMEPLPDTLPAREPESVGLQELAHCVLPLIEELPPKYREPLVLADLDGWSQKSVAQKLDISLSGAKSRIQRARRMLKDLFNQCCELEYDALGHISSVVSGDNCTKCGCASNTSKR